MITPAQYLMGRIKEEDLTPEMHASMVRLLDRVNRLLERFGETRPVSSGYRRPEDNAKVPNPKSHSAHLTCEAVDLLDRTRKLTQWLDANPQVLVEFDLYREDPAYCPTWTHLQIRRPGSGKRTFIP